MLEQDLNIQQIAELLGLSRNTVSLAINRSMFEPSRIRIAKFLKIEP